MLADRLTEFLSFDALLGFTLVQITACDNHGSGSVKLMDLRRAFPGSAADHAQRETAVPVPLI